MNVKAVESQVLSKKDKRFVVIDQDTGEILDDAQGWGYKSAVNAHRAWAYKNRDKTKDKEKMQRKAEIFAWLQEHKSFVRTLDAYAFEIAKGSWDEDDKIDSKLVKFVLNQYKLKTSFKPSEILRVWQSSY